LSRSLYKNKDISLLKTTHKEINWSNFMIVPEGGGGETGVWGCKEIIEENSFAANQFDYWITACGTGTTCAGLAKYSDAQIIGISVLKGEGKLSDYVGKISKKNNFQIFTEYHHGGYAKETKELIDFAKCFSSETQISL